VAEERKEAFDWEIGYTLDREVGRRNSVRVVVLRKTVVGE
jgi:hypothetical protein